MVDTKVQIWSLACDLIGENVAIESEDDDSPAAQVCSRHYATCLREVFEAFPWPFAIRQAVLTQLSDVERTGWEYVYQLPPDCCTPLALLADGYRRGILRNDERIPFEVMADDSAEGRVLCTDYDTTDFEVLEYVALIDLPALYSGHFVNALAARLAVPLASAITKDEGLATRKMLSFNYLIDRAWASEMRGRQEDVEPTTPSLAARG